MLKRSGWKNKRFWKAMINISRIKWNKDSLICLQRNIEIKCYYVLYYLDQHSHLLIILYTLCLAVLHLVFFRSALSDTIPFLVSLPKTFIQIFEVEFSHSNFYNKVLDMRSLRSWKTTFMLFFFNFNRY